MNEGDDQLQPEKVVVTVTPEIHALFRASDKTFIRTFLDEGVSVENTLVAIVALHTALANAYRAQLDEYRKASGETDKTDLTTIETKGTA